MCHAGWKAYKNTLAYGVTVRILAYNNQILLLKNFVTKVHIKLTYTKELNLYALLCFLAVSLVTYSLLLMNTS